MRLRHTQAKLAMGFWSRRSIHSIQNPKPDPLAEITAHGMGHQEIDRRSRAPRLFLCPFGSSLRMHATPNRSAWPHLIDSAVSLSAWLLDRRRAAVLSEGVADETAPPTPP